MNIDTIKNGLTQKFGRTGLVIQKNSPEILLGLGLVGMVATVVMASKATLKVNGLLEAHKETLEKIDEAASSETMPYTAEDAMKDKATVYIQTGLGLARIYGTSIAMGTLSVSAILASHGIMARRTASLVAAYNLLAEGYKNYRERVADELGADVDKDFHLGVQDETHTETAIDEEGKKTKVKKKTKGTILGRKMPSVYSRFFDEFNPQYRTDRTMNKAFLIAQQNYLNDLLVIRGHVFLNEVYEQLGFPHTKEGALVGWVLRSPEQMKAEGRDGHIDLGLFDVENDPSREFINGTNPAILIDPNVDGLIYHLI